MQMAAAVSAVANGGRLVQPRAVRAVIRDGRRLPVPHAVLGRVVSASTMATMTEIMERVVEVGTGERARIPGYTVAGKTGTAKKLVNGSYRGPSDYNVSFVGFVPSRSPVFAIVVVVDTPRRVQPYGGVVAAPIFRGLASEHFCDDVFFDLFAAGEAMPYPGGHAALVEMPPDHFPLNVEQRLFQMNVRGVRPVLAHPERYTPLFGTTTPIERMLNMGVLPQLDVMALVGKYGRAPKKAAERMLKEDVYFIACTDSHRPDDVDIAADAIKVLKKLVGAERADELLSENPRRIIEGRIE
jgi:hypothetical protein